MSKKEQPPEPQKMITEPATNDRRKSSPRVRAGACPRDPRHRNIEVYKTVGRTRLCKCNDCGETWKKIGPFADELREYALELSESLKAAPRSQVGDVTVITMEDSLAKQVAESLYTLATT